jgi:hypothetical protein
MTFYQFNRLDEMQQAEVLLEKGVCLGERHDAEHKIFLYQIEGFYVEEFYHKQHNVPRRIRSFRSTSQLRPYLDKIDIGNLL